MSARRAGGAGGAKAGRGALAGRARLAERGALVGLAALALAGCAGDCRGPARRDEDARPNASERPAPRDSGHVSWIAAKLGGLPSPTPRWHVTLPGSRAGMGVEHVAGPVILTGTGSGEALALMASSAVGVVAVDVDTGEPRWQHDEQAPGPPVIAAGDGEIVAWLPGRCVQHLDDVAPAGAGAGTASEYILGCVAMVDRAGEVRDRIWVRLDEDALLAGAPRRSSALGRRGANLLWAHGADLLEIAMPAGRVVAHYRALAARHDDAGAAETAITGWLDQGSHLIVSTTTGLAGFADCPGKGVCMPAWHQPWPRAVGVTGPVDAASNIAWVRDQILEAGNGGRTAWTAPGFYAYGPGTLTRTDAGSLLALRLGGDGIQPVRIEFGTGRVVEEGSAVPGAQVLVATAWSSGLVAAVRLDASLRHDAVIAWDETLRARWAWPLPEPAHPRIAPVGLAANSDGGVIVFYDGRFAARLPPSDR